jgi:hypothetical protein
VPAGPEAGVVPAGLEAGAVTAPEVGVVTAPEGGVTTALEAGPVAGTTGGGSSASFTYAVSVVSWVFWGSVVEGIGFPDFPRKRRLEAGRQGVNSRDPNASAERSIG